MKVYIGPYKNWFGPHQLAEKICFWAKKNVVVDQYGSKDYPDYVFKLGEWLAYGKWRGVDEIPDFELNSLKTTNEDETWLYKFLQFIEKKKTRKIKVRIDPYDTWSMDTTLAHIVLPMLKQLRATQHGFAQIDMEDVPEKLRLVDNSESYYQLQLFEYEECNPEHINIGEDQWNWILDEMIYAFSILDDDDKAWIHEDDKRVNNGLRLFGKYYRALWD